MLLRFYRFTDKLGIVLLKLFGVTGQFGLEGVTLAVAGLTRGVGGVLLLIWGVIYALLRWLWRALRFIFRVITGIGFRILVILGLASEVRGRGNAGASGNAASAAGRVMARRAQRASARQEMEVGLAEDPLRVQNRTLSFVVVIMGFVLVVAIIWATSAARQPNVPVVPNLGGQGVEQVNFAPEGVASPTVVSIVNTPVPTATPIPAILEARGSIAYVAREKGQQDLWVVNVGSTSPLRITNDESDERDPSWSPDGRRLAYASNRDGNWELYVYDLIADTTTRLTYDLSFQANPSWSPDGVFLVYESYQGNNLDLYILAVDGSELPIRLTEHPAADFSPNWSPDGRRVVFTSWRDGNQDIFVFSLDNPTDSAAVNLTNTPDRYEDYPVWSPSLDGLVAYSALDEGLEKVFVKSANDPESSPQVIGRGRTPAWSPDGTSMVFAVNSVDSTHLVAAPFTQAGVTTEIIPVLLGSSSPTWTSAPLPAPLINSGGLGPAIENELFVEQEVFFDTDPPYRLDTLVNVDAPNPVLNDRVNDSFNALRERAVEVVGYDFLGELEDAFWRIDRPPQPGEQRRNWHMTGRAFAINRNLIAGFPPDIEVVREDLGVGTYWRVYVRVADAAQNGQLGEPLRHMPWDFASRNQGDVEAYDAGGRLRAEMPEGYYVDLTQLAADYGWEAVPAGSDWRANFNSVNYWMFRNAPESLTWYEAMREIYTDAQLGGFVPTPTAAPIIPTPES